MSRAVRILGPGAAAAPAGTGEPFDQTDDEALQGAMFLPRITEMDGRGRLFVEVAGGVEGFKQQIMCVLLRMISEVLNFCDRVKAQARSRIEVNPLLELFASILQ
jgi:hypothetical protein